MQFIDMRYMEPLLDAANIAGKTARKEVRAELERLLKNCDHRGISVLYDQDSRLIQLLNANGRRSEPLNTFYGELHGMNVTLEFLSQDVTDDCIARLVQLEQRIAELENRAASTITDAPTQDEPANTIAARQQHIQQLIERAHEIGTILIEYGNGDGFAYTRPRFLIPGTRYKFYFYVSNAYNTRRKQRSARYIFGPDELGELEKWIAHDEKIFAECNQKYSVPDN